VNHGVTLYLGALLTLAIAWYGMVIGPVMQIGNQQPALIESTGGLYPAIGPGSLSGPGGLSRQWCNYCHTQQARGLAEVKEGKLVRYAGSDLERGWGVRPSVAADFIFDQPVMFGTQRIGQDLANIGARQTNEVWHLTHLYNPQSVSPGSVMPPYRYLKNKRSKVCPRRMLCHRGYSLVWRRDTRLFPLPRLWYQYLLSLRRRRHCLKCPSKQAKA
jgi:cytochrome c oxidase cbb3-type subunit 2